tara:strand:+ start:303 stop:662 length:360 start_codon:yes stop_codon:yes gene_type:complete
MLKKSLTAITAATALAVPAHAGFYLNGEFNQSHVGSDWNGSGIDLHVGYENTIGEKGSFYLQGGPYLSNPKGADGETNISAKIGGGYDVTERLNAYTELSVITDDTNTWGSKAGLKFTF